MKNYCEILTRVSFINWKTSRSSRAEANSNCLGIKLMSIWIDGYQLFKIFQITLRCLYLTDRNWTKHSSWEMTGIFSFRFVPVMLVTVLNTIVFRLLKVENRDSIGMSQIIRYLTNKGYFSPVFWHFG